MKSSNEDPSATAAAAPQSTYNYNIYVDASVHYMLLQCARDLFLSFTQYNVRSFHQQLSISLPQSVNDYRKLCSIVRIIDDPMHAIIISQFQPVQT